MEFTWTALCLDSMYLVWYNSSFFFGLIMPISFYRFHSTHKQLAVQLINLSRNKKSHCSTEYNPYNIYLMSIATVVDKYKV